MSNTYKLGVFTPVRTERSEYHTYRTGLAVRVGASGIAGTAWFADVKGEVKQLNAEIDGLSRELTSDLDQGGPKTKWYNANWVPFLKSWNDFAEEHSHWYNNMFLSSWHGVMKYRILFAGLHAAAKDAGFGIASLPPALPDPDAFQAIGQGVTNRLDTIIHTGLILIVAVVAGIFIIRYVLPAMGHGVYR